jgi:ABC-2 type transport system permease protein
VNPESDTLPEEASRARPAPPAEISTARRLHWLLRRELWESRSVYMAAPAVAGLVVLASLIGAFHVPEAMRDAALQGTAKQHETIVQPYLFAGLVLMGVTFVVSIFYSLDALQSERRDRSILFWKSMPVSDLATVLVKASIPLVILPLLTVVLALVTQVIMLAVHSAALAASGGSAATLWEHVSLPELSLMLAYHMVAVHSLSFAPIYAWLLLVSAWARRVPWLWAILPPFAIGVVERIAFGSSAFADLVLRSMGGGREGMDYMTASMMADPLMQMTPGRFLLSPGLWTGLAVAAVFLAIAARLRRRHGPA